METTGGYILVDNDTIEEKVNLSVPDPTDIPEEDLSWSKVSLSEVMNNNVRFEANVYNIEGRHAREILKNCKWNLVTICGENGLAVAYHFPRFKRIWLEKSPYPIYQPSQIMEINPEPSGYISENTKTDIEALRVKKGQILLTCSGTIGNCTIVNNTFHDKIFSHDLIRINCKNEIDIGYLYAFLRTKIGRTLVNTNNYGAVVQHIEPEHLKNIPIPNPSAMLKKRIHEIVLKSFELRDQSNALLEQAENLLVDELQFPSLNEFEPKYFENSINLENFTVKLSSLANRLDASYHIPLIGAIIDHMEKYAEEITYLGDKRITTRIILAGIFNRIYVDEGNGTPFIGVKEILQLSPEPEKFLSTKHHKKRIEKELKIEENMILISDRGTIGNVVLVPKHFEGYAVSQNVIKIKASSEDIAGYLFVFLNSKQGKALIKRHTYGSVVDMIDDKNVSQIEVPLLKNKQAMKEINDLALQANKRRYEAYKLEQEAIKLVNDEVIYNTKI